MDDEEFTEKERKHACQMLQYIIEKCLAEQVPYVPTPVPLHELHYCPRSAYIKKDVAEAMFRWNAQRAAQ